jgi:hypothetical protein
VTSRPNLGIQKLHLITSLMTLMMVNFPCSHGSINSPAPVISAGIQTQPARDYQRQKTYCSISMVPDFNIVPDLQIKSGKNVMTLAVAKVGMSTSGFFCPTVLQSVQYESHSKDLGGYRPNLVTRAYPQLVCQLEGDQSQAIAFDVSRRLVFSPSSCLS